MCLSIFSIRDENSSIMPQLFSKLCRGCSILRTFPFSLSAFKIRMWCNSCSAMTLPSACRTVPQWQSMWSCVASWLLPSTTLPVSQGRISLKHMTCLHDEKVQIKLARSPSHRIMTLSLPVQALTPATPGAWQGGHLNDNFEVTGMTWPGKAGFYPHYVPLSRPMPYH